MTDLAPRERGASEADEPSRRTCIDVLEHVGDQFGSRPLTFIQGEASHSIALADLGCSARRFAGALQHLGVVRGDAVAVQLTNRFECAVVYQAVLLCGATLVPIIHIYGPSETTFILSESRAKVFITTAQLGSFRPIAHLSAYSRIATLSNIVVIDAESGPGYSTWAELDRTAAPYERPTAAADDVCALMYTSGTTSAPKGVQHTHDTILAEINSMRHFIAGQPEDVYLASFPPGHIAGLCGMLRPMTTGTRTVFMDRWNPDRATEVIEQFTVTATSGAPVHLQGLLDVCGGSDALTSMREFLVGAAPVSKELGARAAAAGIHTFRCYGSTEHPTVTAGKRSYPESVRLSTDGAALPGCSVRIVAADGRQMPMHDQGEVQVRGPEQFVGYRDAQLNASAFTPDGWFRTGDLGHVDDEGFLTITDRIKDVIIRAGETISSSQVEAVLATHPAVAEAAAIAAPDSRNGEVVAAVVVVRAGASIDLDSVRSHFREAGLARQKTPERLMVVEAMPRTALGKVRKDLLRRRLA